MKLQGDIYNHESLVSAIKQVDVVISAVGTTTIADQVKIIAAIKEVGTIKASNCNFSIFLKSCNILLPKCKKRLVFRDFCPRNLQVTGIA